MSSYRRAMWRVRVYRQVQEPDLQYGQGDGGGRACRRVAPGVDKPRLQSGESATFTVLDKGTDVTASAKIKNVTSGDYLDGATFTMGSDKTVQFVAEYNDKTSQTLSVGSGNFHKSVMVLKFTSIGCSYCPQMATALEKANESYDNGTRMVEVSVHHPIWQ